MPTPPPTSIRKGQRFTVALTVVGRSEPLPEVLKRLLREAAKASVRPRYLLLDRGFCSVDVIRYLQAARYAWLMPLTLRGRKPDHPQGPSGSRLFAPVEAQRLGAVHDDQRRPTEGHLPVCVKCRNRRGERGRRGREALVYAFGGPLRPSSYTWVKETYRSRFAIETSYRQMHQARIRTCTRDPLLRLLYVAIASNPAQRVGVAALGTVGGASPRPPPSGSAPADLPSDAVVVATLRRTDVGNL